MAAIALSCQLAISFSLLLAAVTPLRADRVADIRAQITYVASALADSNPTDALNVFDKSLANYDKLSQYFAGLTTSFDVVSEVEILDENDTDQGTTLKLSWALQVSDRVNSAGVRRIYDVQVHLKRLQGKWKITGFTPVEMFNPQSALSPNK